MFGALSVQRRDGHVAFSQMLRPLVVATPDLVFRWGGMASSFAKKMGVIYPGWWFQIFFDFQPYLEKMIQFDEHIFQSGWFNHQLVYIYIPIFIWRYSPLGFLFKIGDFVCLPFYHQLRHHETKVGPKKVTSCK